MMVLISEAEGNPGSIKCRVSSINVTPASYKVDVVIISVFWLKNR